MPTSRKSFTAIEPLEARIAPAAVFPTIPDAENDPTGKHFKSASVGGPILLKAGDVLTTGTGPKSGSYLLFVEQGQCLVFSTDLNNNNVIDFNEITGISAGDGLRMVSFVDIHGDIVTNLKANGTLSDSNNNNGDDDPGLKGDGRVLLNSRIEKVELRSLRFSDLTDQNSDSVVDVEDIGARLVLSSYSIFGQIIAGAGFGVSTDNTSGLIIDDSGKIYQQQFFIGPTGGSAFGPDYYDGGVTPIKSMIGGIVVGSAASGEFFSFGINHNTANDPTGSGDVNGRDLQANGNDIQGTIRTFTPSSGTTGAGISWVRGANANVTFNIGRLVAGDGGLRAPGGSITNVTLNGDDAGGYVVTAGNGGGGANGANGGSILDFQDIGSNTSEVIIRAGTGGNGTTGSGGAGGGVTFGTMNVLGSVLVQEGDGGNGFTNGGNGASLGKAVVTSPDRLADFVRNIVGTTHDSPHNPVTGKRIIANPLQPGVVGQGNAVDFDGDGIGDIVFTSSNPSQLVVQFGDGFGGFRRDPNTGLYDRIYLDGPLDAEALTIGDYDGDGHYDIATGSTRGGDHAGITVFLSKYEDANGDGILTASEDLNGNGVDDILGFRAPRYSPLPSLTDAAAAAFGAARSGHSIADLEAGDFNGDGFTDLAVCATYYEPVTLAPFQFVIFMYPDVEEGKPTGQFYADFGTKAQAVPPQSANPFLPSFIISGRGDTTANIEVTALSVFSPYDVVIALADNGAAGRALQVLDNSVPTFFGPSATGIPLGVVDTNRDLPTTGPNIALTTNDVNGADFTVLDFDQDGLADFVAIVEIPAGFMVVLQGDGLGGASRTDFQVTGAQNAGFYFGPPTNGNGGLNLTTSLQAIVTSDADGDGVRDDVAVLFNQTIGQANTQVMELRVGFPPGGGLFPSVGVFHNPGAGQFRTFVPYLSVDPSIVAFDAYYPFPASGGVPDSTVVNYAVGEPEVVNDGINLIRSVGDLGGGRTFTTEHYFRIEAGDGGAGLIGRGGNGGNLGDAFIDPNTLVGAIDLRINLADVQFVAGNGGNGFSSGGKGGNVKGVVLDGSTGTLGSFLSTEIRAGNGGLAVSGVGGSGGDIIGASVFAGGIFVAGSGGRGVSGGNGGSIIGNGIKGLYDTQDLFQQMSAGSGGNGIKRGGNGGSILNFHSSVDLNSDVETGTLIYLAGDGGSAVSGPGGNGGSIINSSPLDEDRNQLAGDIYLRGGRGGDGRTGGNGGSVDTFLNSTDQFQVPAIVSFLGGDGGDSTKGPAGSGGSVKNIITASTGAPNPFAFSATSFTFSRAAAGRGGDSSGNTGGNGGSIVNVNISAKDNPLAIAAGAGGDGLFRGGKGGSVTDATLQVGNTSFGKAVVIAGDGGDATAYLANGLDPATLQTAIKAFGGRVGRGGDGGAITNVSQLGGILSRMDLIAGNGGDTVNYGTIADISSFVGRGGSISQVFTDGSIGNLDAQVPIKSYNNVRSGESMDQFVVHNLRDESSPGSVSDTAGNVGIVTGAAGRIKSVFNGYTSANLPIFPSSPAVGGINGSLTSVTARNIMAAVSGSVERIAAIQSVKDINLTGGGVIGADKDTFNDPDNLRRFVSKDLVATPAPVLDGILIDGAMVARSRPTDLAGKSVNLGADIYVIA